MEETRASSHTQQVTHEQASPRYWMNGALLCNAHNGAGKLCSAIAVRGKTKCRKHGGRSLEGLAHPSLKNGRYSKHLPAQIASRADEARHDPQLLSLADDIAVHQALLAQAFARLETGESGAAWRAIGEALDALEVALAQGDSAALLQQHQTMRQLVTQGVGQAAVLEDVRKVEETHIKLVQTHVKTLQALQQMITVQQNQLMLGAVMNALVEAVKQYADVPSGRKILMAVGTEMTRLSTLEGR